MGHAAFNWRKGVQVCKKQNLDTVSEEMTIGFQDPELRGEITRESLSPSSSACEM